MVGRAPLSLFLTPLHQSLWAVDGRWLGQAKLAFFPFSCPLYGLLPGFISRWQGLVNDALLFAVMVDDVFPLVLLFSQDVVVVNVFLPRSMLIHSSSDLLEFLFFGI